MRILVPTDFSPLSDAALAHARVIGAGLGTSLHLLHVAAASSSPALAAATMSALRQRLTDDERDAGGLEGIAEGPDAAAEITDYAARAGIGLVVMGTHGRSGLAHLLVGSVAERVIRTAPCPVLTVHGAPAGPFRRILVPTDFSEPAEAAFEWARVMARRFGASLHLLHVLSDVRADGSFGADALADESPDARTLRLADARERLAHHLTAVDRAGLHATSEVILGPSASVVADYAGDNGFDLIVMGTHGRTGLAHLVIGSVAERVVRSAACPVLTTRAVRPALAPALMTIAAERAPA